MNEASSEFAPLLQAAIEPKPQIKKGVGTKMGITMSQNGVSPEIDKVKKELVSLRTISKKHDQEGRGATALAVSRARTEGRTTRDTIAAKGDKLQKLDEEQRSLYLAERQIAKELAQRQEKLLVKLKKLAGLGDKRAAYLQRRIETAKSERAAVLAERFETERELESMRGEMAEIPDPKELLDLYYERIHTLPLTNEEKRELLSPDVLVSLSTEEYIDLWRRLNPYFLSHVTRQGFRDHNAMVYHSAGLGEFHNGFLHVLEDDRSLRPPLALEGLRTRDEVSVTKFLSGWVLQAGNEGEARERLHRLLHFHLASAPKYPDETAVHFAAQLVADDYYGGERGNEVFFIYPSDVIASQYPFAFNGWEKDFTQPQSETKWNDVFVWPHELDNPGIPLDAGLVFLPETTAVDPNTGSKYASEIRVVDEQETRVMVENTKLVHSFVEWGKGLNDSSPVRGAFAEYRAERDYYLRQVLERKCLTAFSQELQRLGFSEDASAALGHKFMSELHWQTEITDEVLLKIVRSTGANWKRAENTVPAREYWENYFARYPQLRPKHLVYYDGDPTTAVLAFQQKYDIGKADTSKTDGQLLGFDDHHVADVEKDPRANQGYEKLFDLANKIIFEHYKSSELVSQDLSKA